MRQLKITKSITNRESASLDKYLQEIGREELVTPEEEVELAQKIRNNEIVYVDDSSDKRIVDEKYDIVKSRNANPARR